MNEALAGLRGVQDRLAAELEKAAAAVEEGAKREREKDAELQTTKRKLSEMEGEHDRANKRRDEHVARLEKAHEEQVAKSRELERKLAMSTQQVKSYQQELKRKS
jgi:hypothetical protein